MKLDLVHFTADDFKKQVPEPTAEQLQKQFDDFKNTPRGSSTEQNPFGFGYLEPSRVTLLYLTVPAAEVAKKLRGEPDSEQYFDWRTKAVRGTGTGWAEVALCYTGDLSDPDERLYTLDYYLALAERIATTVADRLRQPAARRRTGQRGSAQQAAGGEPGRPGA